MNKPLRSAGWKTCFLLAGFLAFTSEAPAYELETHELLTENAIAQSVLQRDPRVLSDLGVAGGIEKLQFPNDRGRSLTIRALLVFGSRAEDRTPRYTRHFYNPVTGRGMNAGNFPNQTTSPDWTLAPVGTFPDQTASYWDARQALFTALTHQTDTERNRNFGLVFQTLGQVVHHLQDMAQPQHVRNDVHCGAAFLGPVIGPVAGEVGCALVRLPHRPSFYEAWTNSTDVHAVLGPRLNPAFAGYNVESPAFRQVFNAPRRFWHTEAPGPNSPAAGQGMAEFSNRNFLSAHTNFNLPSPPNFALPAFDPGRAVELSIGELCSNSLIGCDGPLLEQSDARVTFYGSAGRDNFLGVDIPFSATSSESIFDERLQPLADGARMFALNRFNFDEFYNYLIPRAVAHSAGLINYFFRGKVDFTRDDQGRSRIVNAGSEAMSGRFALYYDAIDGNRYPVRVDPADPNIDPADANAWRLAIAPLNPGSPGSNLSAPISFIVPANDGSPTSPRAANEYMLVFSGEMGEEKPGSGMIGTVAAKHLKTEINGTLYVKVLRNNFTEAILRVDKSGTQYLPPGDFNPLENFQENAGFPNRAHWQAAWYKQVEFRPLPFGGYDYTVLSFNIPNQFIGHASYVRGAAGNFERRQRPITWVAKNTPHGDFEFSLPFMSFDGHSSAQYTRRYTENGQPRVEQGTMPWPSFSAPGLTNRAGGVDSQPVISGNGLRISGLLQPLAQQSSTVGGVAEFRTDMVEHQVVLSPGAVPSAGLQTGAAQPYRLSRQWTETSSHHTNQIPGECGFASESTLNFLGHEESLVRTLHGIGPINGGPKVVEYSDAATGRFGYNVVDNQYPIGCLQGQFAIRFTGSGDSEDLRINATSITAPGGANQASDNLTNFALSRNPPFGFGHATRPAYDVVGSPPPWIPKPVTRGKQLSLIKALGEKADDAFYQEMDVAAGTNPMKFRTHTVTFSSVADVSPAGEIFFATEDGATLIHEPLQGGIPRIVLPPDVIRILGALWL